MTEDKVQQNSGDEPLTVAFTKDYIAERDFWKRAPITDEKKHEVRLITDQAIMSGSCLEETESKAFGTNLASGGRDNYCEVIALSMDIRKSAITLVNVEDFAEYNRVLADFICYIKDTWRSQPGRFFDKFTGDGALCFWVLPEEPPKHMATKKVEDGTLLLDHYYYVWNDRVKKTIEFSIDITCKFLEIFLPSIRRTCGLIPKDFGFSLGIDVGQCLLTELRSSRAAEAPKDHYEELYGPIKCKDFHDKGEIVVSDNVTIIGRPVIGATRMTTAANAYEILVNCYPGSELKTRIDDPSSMRSARTFTSGFTSSSETSKITVTARLRSTESTPTA
ncbi:MAG: hypothetical protein GTO24_05245 [candidate division Zixibacteria bacterium]|nr:hypothetical protein [candidate division Zixibacteria bacterium]